LLAWASCGNGRGMTKGTRPETVHQGGTGAPEIEKTRREGLRQYGKLAAGCFALAAAIAAIVAYLTPLEDMTPPESLAPDSIVARPLPEALATQPTIQLPAQAITIPAEELRTELLALAEDLLARVPKVPEALHVVAWMYADLQRVTEAERIWQECIRLAPKHVGPYVGLATAAMKLGKDEEAVAILQQAISAGCASPELEHELAAALTKLGRLQEAAEVLEKGLAAYSQAAENWLQLGQIQIQLGQFAQAEASLQQAIAQGTSDGSVYFSLATACARQGKQEEAAKYRQIFGERKAEQAAAGDTPFQLRYDAELRKIALASFCRAGTVYDRQGDTAEAERLLLRALALSPANLVVCGELTTFYRRLGRIADARLVQRRMVDAQPENTVHYVNLASLASQLGDYAAAEEALQTVVGKRPDLSIGYSGLAQLYLQAGKLDQARWFAEAALRMEPASPEETVQTYLVLATVCQRLGDQTAAQAALAEAQQRTSGQVAVPHANLSQGNAAGVPASRPSGKQP
jgi:tetratricopeptide (TPR) repeat protein